MRYSDMFIGGNPKGEVRAEWSSLYQSFHRHKFMITLDSQQVPSGGKSFEEATDEFTRMFDRMEEWCDANCAGFWTIWDNDDEIDDDAPEVEFEIHFMFELEDDLIRYIRDCAILSKLSH